MLFKNIGLVDENFKFQENMFVATAGNRIAYIGETCPDNAEAYGEAYDGTGKILMPGFYNAHAHSPMTLMRGYAENLPLQQWLDEYILPFEDQHYEEGVYWATLLAQAESIRYGIVSSTEMYFFTDQIVRAISEAGTRGTIGRSVVHFGDSKPEDSQRFREMCQTIEMYHGWADGRILTACDLHAEYTNDEDMMRAVAEAAKKYDVGVQIHCAETKHETEGCIRRHGMTPVKFLEHCGILDQPCNLAHCVWLTDEDIEILKKHEVTVTSCPSSNLKLADGIADVPKMLGAGINVAIGTDSVASNNSLNFLEELKLLALLGKIKANDPSAMKPEQVLYCATRAGALAQGRKNCGLIKEGYMADMIVIDANQPNMRPIHNAINNLVFSADGKDVCLTMVDGRVLYRDGEYLTLDVDRIIKETDKVVEKMLAAVKDAE